MKKVMVLVCLLVLVCSASAKEGFWTYHEDGVVVGKLDANSRVSTEAILKAFGHNVSVIDGLIFAEEGSDYRSGVCKARTFNWETNKQEYFTLVIVNHKVMRVTKSKKPY